MTVVHPLCTREGAVDHPSTWLELLELLPASAVNGPYVNLNKSDAGPSWYAAIRKLQDVKLDEGRQRGHRRFDIEVRDQDVKFDASFNLSVDATVDNLAVSLHLAEMDDLVLHEPVYATWLAVAVIALGEQIQEAVSQMHRRLAADLTETVCELTIIMPNEKFGAIQALCLEELKGGVAPSARPAGLRFIGAFANAAPAPEPARPAKEKTRLVLSTEQRLALALNLCTLREARGLKQLEVAFRALGFEKSHAAVSRLERGILNEVESERLEKLASFFDTTVEALLANKAVSDEPSTDIAPEAQSVKSIFDPDADLAPAAGFGNRIALARTSAGMSQSALADELDHRSDVLVQQWEAEDVSPRRVTFIDIAIALNVPVSWLMFGKRTETPARGIGLRLTAMQKLYHLSNSELAALMENTEDISTVEATGHMLSRLSRNRHQPSPEKLRRMAYVLQVPEDWIAPPPADKVARRAEAKAALKATRDVLDSGSPSSTPKGEQLQGLSKAGLKLVTDLVDLLQMGIISDKDARDLRGELIAKFTTPYIRRGRGAGAEVAS